MGTRSSNLEETNLLSFELNVFLTLSFSDLKSVSTIRKMSQTDLKIENTSRSVMSIF